MTSSSERPPETPETKSPRDESAPGFGWTAYAEVINGRFAMIGLAGLLLLEWIAHKDFFTWLGVR